jgi:hypothetical protein
MSWTHRVSHSLRTPPLRQVQAVAENLAGQAGIAPGRTRVAFQVITDVVILTSAAIVGTLGTIHLWKTFFPKHKDDPHDHEAAGSDRSPPHRRGPPASASFAGRHDGHEHRGHQFR